MNKTKITASASVEPINNVSMLASRWFDLSNGLVISIDNLWSLLNHKVKFNLLAFDHDVGYDEVFKDIDIGRNKRYN